MREHSAVRLAVPPGELPLIGPADLMWSDPDDIDNWAVSPRGAGWLFGGNITRQVC